VKNTSISRVLSKDGRILVVSLPIAFKQHGGRKRILTPAGSMTWSPNRPQPRSALVTALAKAHRWRKLIENGGFSTTAELARSEGVNESYLCRIIRLTSLAPDIISAVLNGEQTPELKRLLNPLPGDWNAQRKLLRVSDATMSRASERT
jgi:hypothetical protein